MEGTRRRVARTLGAAQLVSSVGDGSFYVTSALFFSYVLGLSPTQIGATLTVAWGAGFALTAPVGHLGDRFGLRGSAIALSVATAAALATFALASTLPVFVAITVIYAVGQSGASAIRQALLVTLIPPAERVLVRARFQAVANGGIAVGAAIGGVAIYIGSTATFVSVFVFDAVTFLIGAALLSGLPVVTASPAAPDGRAAVLRDRPYVVAASLNAVLYLYMPVLSVVLPLFIAQRTGAPGWMIAALFIMNTIGVVVLQVPVARRVVGLPGAVRAVRGAGCALFGACLLFWAASQPESAVAASLVLVLGLIVQVLGEVCLAAGSWEIGFGLADPARPGQWQGLYSAGIPLARAIGPVTVTTLVLAWPGPGWLVLGGVFAAAAFSMAPVVAWGERAQVAQAA